MATLTIAEAARCCRVARSTLQRAIQTGRLSLTHDHRIDTAELLRAGYTLHAAQQSQTAPTRQPHETENGSRAEPHSSSVMPQRAAPDTALLQQRIADLEREKEV
ncbi:MAG TPA: hypothetical protein VI542_08845 [Candidatus Tectomicrobia bacterium]